MCVVPFGHPVGGVLVRRDAEGDVVQIAGSKHRVVTVSPTLMSEGASVSARARVEV